MSIALNIPAETHGRYLVDTPSAAPPAGLLVGFHGYGEGAEAELARLQSIPGAGNWLLVSIQGLHRFYNRQAQQVVASWMTSQDRELAIADNLRYVAAVLEVVARDLPTDAPCVFAGFSQGVAMAFRAACNSAHPVAGIISAGGDVPPELERDALTRVHAALIARGRNDEWYSSAKWAADEARLRAASVTVETCGFEGGHEWTGELAAAAGGFLSRLTPSR